VAQRPAVGPLAHRSVGIGRKLAHKSKSLYIDFYSEQNADAKVYFIQVLETDTKERSFLEAAQFILAEDA
jgi:hypothetical protein